MPNTITKMIFIRFLQYQSARFVFLAILLCWVPAISYSQSVLQLTSELSLTVDLLNAAMHSRLLEENIGVVSSTRYCEINQIRDSFKSAKNILNQNRKTIYSEKELGICRIFSSFFYDKDVDRYVIIFNGYNCGEFYDAISYYLNRINLENAIEIGVTLKSMGRNFLQLRQARFVSIANELLLDHSRCVSLFNQSKFTVARER